MKFIILLFACWPQKEPIKYQTVSHSEVYEFRVNYWFNMHHFLKQESFLQAEMDSSIVSIDLPSSAMKGLKEAVDYYKKNLGEEDLRTSDYMSDFKLWVTEIDDNPTKVPEGFKEHFDIIRSFSPIYHTYFWEEHEANCEAALEKYLPIIKRLESSYWEQITDATKAFVLEDTIKIDVVYYGKSSDWNLRNRPYTTIFPTRLVMNTYNFDEIEGEWVELLFHESAHALILSRTGFVAGTIIDVAQNMDVKIPRQLGHSYLFYMTGYFAQKLLEKDGIAYPSIYMQSRNVFSRYHSSLKKLDSYLEGDQTLSKTTADILTDLTKN